MSQKYSDEPVEGPEIRGLIGRAYKQLFVEDGDAESLRAAIGAYRFDWERRQGDHRWHGINLVSLLSRAKRDGISIDNALDATEIARQIHDDIEEQGATGIWDYATSMEVAIAQQDERAILNCSEKIYSASGCRRVRTCQYAASTEGSLEFGRDRHRKQALAGPGVRRASARGRLGSSNATRQGPGWRGF